MDGAYAGKGQSHPEEQSKGVLISHDNVCTAQNGHSGDGVYATASCCEMSNSDYELVCMALWGDKSGGGMFHYVCLFVCFVWCFVCGVC